MMFFQKTEIFLNIGIKIGGYDNLILIYNKK